MRRLFLLFAFVAACSFAQAQTDTNAAAPTPPSDDAPLVSRAPGTVGSGSLPGTMVPGGNMPATQGEEIDDIRPPFFFLRSWFWLWVALGALALIALLFFLWRMFKPNRQLSAKSAYELALEKLEKARTLLREEEPMPYALAVSEAVRTYLGQRFQQPSTRRTTEEFLRQMERDRATPLAEHRDFLRSFLTACDLVKFGRYHPKLAELEEVHGRAHTFVLATKPEPAAANGHHP
jgi:hypothetical protein